MTPLDQKTIDSRKHALNMAIASHGENQDHVKVLASAKMYHEFMTSNPMSADAPDLPQMVTSFRAPSGLPADWSGDAPLPHDTIDSVIAAAMSLPELQELRRRQLFELDTVANAIRAKGAVPC